MKVEAQVKSPKSKHKGAKVTIDYDFGADLGASVAKFGEEVIHRFFVAGAKVAKQASMRAGLEAGKSPGDVAQEAATSPLGLRRTAMTKAEKFERDFGKLSGEEQSRALKSLAQRAKAAA